MVERVVCLQAKLQAAGLTFAQTDVLEEAHIPLVQAGTAEAVEAGVHLLTSLDGGRKARRVDERIDVAFPTGTVRIARKYHARSDVLAAGNLTVQLRCA